MDESDLIEARGLLKYWLEVNTTFIVCFYGCHTLNCHSFLLSELGAIQ